jgi:hypothetical protein
MKAVGGVVVLTLGALIAGAAGIRVVQNMIDENGKSRIELFADGTDNPTYVTLGDPSAKIRLALPSEPNKREHEALTYFGVVRQVDREISPAGKDSVQILWFRIIPALARNPQATLSSLASTQASNLGGSAPVGAHLVSTGTVAAYDFGVHPTGSASNASDYSVRIMMRGDVVYVLRVEAKRGGPQALAKVVNSITWL